MTRTINLTLAIAATILWAFVLGGCTGPLIAVDKSVHIHANVNADSLSRVTLETRATNTSDTTADGNTASAEAGLTIPLLP